MWMLTMEQSRRGRVKVLSDWTWKGIRGAPTSLSNAVNSLFVGADRPDDLSWALFISVFRFCQRLNPLVPIFTSISSGIGTSRIVSSPSVLSKFGHDFLIACLPRNVTRYWKKKSRKREKNPLFDKKKSVFFLSFSLSRFLVTPLPQWAWGWSVCCDRIKCFLCVCRMFMSPSDERGSKIHRTGPTLEIYFSRCSLPVGIGVSFPLAYIAFSSFFSFLYGNL